MTRASEAYDAGLRPGDVIVGFNGQTIDDPSQFLRLVADAKPGTTAVVKVLRARPDDGVQAADRLDVNGRAIAADRVTASASRDACHASNSLNARLRLHRRASSLPSTTSAVL